MEKLLSGIGALVEGVNAVTAAFETNRVKSLVVLNYQSSNSKKLKELISKAEKNKIEIKFIVNKHEWKFHPRHSVVAICKEKKTFKESEIGNLRSSKVLVLDHLQDTNNVGAIIRSAAAFDFKIICIPKKRSVQINEKTFSMSSGGIEYIDIVFYNSIFTLIKQLKKLDFWTIGLDMQSNSSESLNNINTQKVSLFLGSEEKGLSTEVKNKLDFIHSIEMNKNIESLNASVSAAIAMYQFFKKDS
ncbi:MAG: RNA methyltransferase [Actinomycetota bacterium]|nr:RNA methyltransferase [Actinomycetota bacterium]